MSDNSKVTNQGKLSVQLVISTSMTGRDWPGYSWKQSGDNRRGGWWGESCYIEKPFRQAWPARSRDHRKFSTWDLQNFDQSKILIPPTSICMVSVQCTVCMDIVNKNVNISLLYSIRPDYANVCCFYISWYFENFVFCYHYDHCHIWAIALSNETCGSVSLNVLRSWKCH